jgi:hypothetical protein
LRPCGFHPSLPANCFGSFGRFVSRLTSDRTAAILLSLRHHLCDQPVAARGFPFLAEAEISFSTVRYTGNLRIL